MIYNCIVALQCYTDWLNGRKGARCDACTWYVCRESMGQLPECGRIAINRPDIET